MKPDDTASLTASSLEAALLRVRTGARPFVTNFFISPAQYETSIRRGLRVLSNRDRFLILGRQEERCERIFFAGSEGEMGAALSELAQNSTGPRVVDLVGRPSTLKTVMGTLTDARFHPYLRLVRMSRLGAYAFSGPAGGRGVCEAAQPSDIPSLHALLRDQFDPVTDQFPGDQEMEDAIAAGEVHVARVADGPLAGFLWHERTGATSHMRYWGVNPALQTKGVGGLLMRDYFQRTGDCSRHLLWVRENNSAARGCYEHYGYHPDGLEDQIMLKDH